jgi:hypothetical protein
MALINTAYGVSILSSLSSFPFDFGGSFPLARDIILAHAFRQSQRPASLTSASGSFKIFFSEQQPGSMAALMIYNARQEVSYILAGLMTVRQITQSE